MILIVFNYNVSDFLNNAEVLSSIRSKAIMNSGSELQSIESKLSSEDEDLIKKFLKSGCMPIANVFSGYTKGITDTDGVIEIPAFEFDAKLGEVENQIIFRINMPDTFNVAVAPSIDDSIKDALESYTLYRIAKHKAIEFQSYKQDYDTSLGSIQMNINARNCSTRRNYRMW